MGLSIASPSSPPWAAPAAPLEVAEPQDPASFAHGLVDRFTKLAAVDRPGASLGEQAEGAGKVFLHEAITGLKRFAVLAVEALGVLGEGGPLALDVLRGVGADDEAILGVLDRRREQLGPGELAVLLGERFPHVRVAGRGNRLGPLAVFEEVLGRSAEHVRSEERRVGKECRSRWSP